MLLVAAVLIAFISNLDNLTVGLSFGMRSTRIATGANAIIAGVTMVATWLAMVLGSAIVRTVPASVVDLLGGLVLIGIGAVTILGAARVLRQVTDQQAASPSIERLGARRASTGRKQARHGPIGRRLRAVLEVDLEHRGSISAREAIVLGIALSANNVATGVGAGASGVSPLATTLLAGVLSLVCVGGGSTLGSSVLARLLGRVAPLVAGVLLIAIGAVIAAR